MARDHIQILLDGPDCSGRGVRYRVLGPSELDAVLLVSSKLAGESAGQAATSITIAREGVKRFLVAVTSKGDLTDADLAEATWVPLDASKLEMPGALSYDELFTAMDDAILGAIYRKHHFPSQATIERIAGKALPVSAG